MTVNNRYIVEFKLLVAIECVITVVFLGGCFIALFKKAEPVYGVVMLIGLFILSIATFTTLSSYMEFVKDIDFLSKVSVSYVTVSGRFHRPTVVVYTTDNYSLLMHGVRKVYNKDIKEAVIDRKAKVLYIPYSSNIHREQLK